MWCCKNARTLAVEFLFEVSCVSVGLRASTASERVGATAAYEKNGPLRAIFLEVELWVVRAFAAVSPLLVFVRAQKQDAANKVHEQERTHAKRGGVALLALVNSPADDRHGTHPCERDNQKGAGDGRNKAKDEID